MEKRILVYNNRTWVAEKVVFMCRQEGIEVLTASEPQQMYQLLESYVVHLILFDAELSDTCWNKDMEIIMDLRKRSRIPFIVVSDQTAESAKIMALDAGADDYVTADCNPLVLLARIKSQIRRYTAMAKTQGIAPRVFRMDGLTLDATNRKVTVDGREVRLTPIEYKILFFLVQHRGKPFSLDQIYENVWGVPPVNEDKTIMVHICHIRKKIEENPRQPKYLKAVWGYGYKAG